jgi:hypothetical protein
MDTEPGSMPANESLDDLFDLDIRVYVMSEEEDEEALYTIPNGSSTRGCGTTSGCL